MTPFRNLSIRNKLTAIILLITVTAIGSAFAFAVATQVRTFKREMVANTLLIARVIGDYSVSDLAFGDASESRRTLERLGAVPNIQYASLYDAKGRLLATYGDGAPRHATPPVAGEAPEFRGGALHVTQPIAYKGERYGTIHLCASTRDLDSNLATYLLTMLTGMAGLTLLAFFVALRLQAVLSAPILKLAEVARRISKDHDYSVRVEKAGEDEIGALCDGFNEMLVEIHERELQRDLADRRTREKSQFLANMSHELRTPLNSIIGFSEVLLGRLAGRLNTKELKFLQNINNSGQHLLGIINDILDLSKVEAGKMEVHPSTFSVRGVIDGVCHVMRGVSGKRNVTLSVEIAEDAVSIEADPVKFKQILYNLVSNGVKFSPYNATVTIRVRSLASSASPLGEDSVEIVVADQGPGIDPKDHALIFQEFRQTEGGAAQVEGTGLGLALVKKFAELHRGVVGVESGLGQGTAFTVTLPRGFAAAAESLPQILVVGDDAAGYEAVRRQLGAAGYAPLRARNKDEALRLARSAKPAAITLDLLLAKPDGWEVLKGLKADPETRSIPVVMVSVLDGQELGPALGAADYFTTPLDRERLVKRVQSLTPGSTPAANRVLVIDDESSVHEMLEAWLGPQGYALDHARSGPEGIERALARTPDLIVLDLLMDEMDGFEVALRLKTDARTASVPIVVLTAKDLMAQDRLRLRGKIAALVRKGPATEARLVLAIQALLHARAKDAASGE